MFRELAAKQSGVNGLCELGQVANEFAQADTFHDYRIRKSFNTLRRQAADLNLFEQYLTSKGVEVGDLVLDPRAWSGITWGLLAGFQKWQLGQGYSMGSVNVRTSTVKTYAKLAFKAGVLGPGEFALIQAVEMYGKREFSRMDATRQAKGLAVRVGSKKADHVSISDDQATQLKSRPDTPQGRRDQLLMCLLLDHGLRVGEVAGLRVDNFDLSKGTFTVFRPKTGRTQTFRLTTDTLLSAIAYSRHTNKSGPLLLGSDKTGRLVGVMSTRAINRRVSELGILVDLVGLSPHDCRHYCATKLARIKNLRELMDVFGWSSPGMAIRYIESLQVVDAE